MALKHDPEKLEDELCFAIYTAQKDYNKFYTESLKEFSLTYPQYITLLSLWETSPVMVKELGAKLHLDNGTLTPLLKRMEKDDWILRTRDPEDERRVNVSLTEKAKRSKNRIMKQMSNCFTSFDMTEEEYLGYVNELKVITNKLENRGIRG
ncbi:MarR family winged helix-turn-helix transcriptional regulator [Dellaglioa sp. P0083]|uniref:MarR family winged helix-turn-helix transcriptional regulator n=1 Tax=Dellaglioa kimchii TaxID=3344667 RepID=UPI0038D423C0